MPSKSARTIQYWK